MAGSRWTATHKCVSFREISPVQIKWRHYFVCFVTRPVYLFRPHLFSWSWYQKVTGWLLIHNVVREIFRCLHCGQFRGIILRVDIREREREREREFYLQLHCRHTRRAISPSKLVPILSNTYNERYTKENIHRQRKQTNEEKKQIMSTYNNETSKDYKQYTILSMIILLPIILIKMNENAFSTIYHIIQH